MSALSEDIVCNSSVICIDFGMQLGNVVRAASGVSAEADDIRCYRGVHWTEPSSSEHRCACLLFK